MTLSILAGSFILCVRFNQTESFGRVFYFCLFLTLGDIYPIIKLEGDEELPTISSFYGIFILMHLTRKEHNPLHIHVLHVSVLVGEKINYIKSISYRRIRKNKK